MDRPESLAAIDTGAFNMCSSLASVEIPDAVTTIGTSAFLGCSSLTSVVIPVASIGPGAFHNAGCPESMYVANSQMCGCSAADSSCF